MNENDEEIRETRLIYANIRDFNVNNVSKKCGEIGPHREHYDECYCVHCDYYKEMTSQPKRVSRCPMNHMLNWRSIMGPHMYVFMTTFIIGKIRTLWQIT